MRFHPLLTRPVEDDPLYTHAAKQSVRYIVVQEAAVWSLLEGASCRACHREGNYEIGLPHDQLSCIVRTVAETDGIREVTALGSHLGPRQFAAGGHTEAGVGLYIVVVCHVFFTVRNRKKVSDINGCEEIVTKFWTVLREIKGYTAKLGFA